MTQKEREHAVVEVFELRNKLIEAYREYASSFMRIRDERIKARVDEAFDTGRSGRTRSSA